MKLKSFFFMLIFSLMMVSTVIRGATPDLKESSKTEKLKEIKSAKVAQNSFLKSQFVILNFDTQDNLVRENCGAWVQNINLDDLKPIQEVGLWRDSNTTIWIKSKVPVSWVSINNFPYPYHVKKISSKYYQIKSTKFPEYWNGTDIIEIAVKK